MTTLTGRDWGKMVDIGRRWRNSNAGFREIMAFDNRWEIVLRRLFFRNTGIITYRKGGMEIVVDHHGGDETGTRACLVSDMYRSLLPSMKLEKPITLLDIGSNGGGFALMLADAGYRLRKVAAVEMNPRVFARMQLNITQNLDVEHALFNAAVCGEADTIEAEMGRGSTGESIAGSKGRSSHGQMRTSRIEGITFDQLFDRAFSALETVDLCKMDIEGSEYGIFSHGHCARLARCAYLIVEIHAVPGTSPQSVIDAINQHGFVEMPRPTRGEPDVFCFRNIALT